VAVVAAAVVERTAGIAGAHPAEHEWSDKSSVSASDNENYGKRKKNENAK
jgi:hypothetical protein